MNELRKEFEELDNIKMLLLENEDIKFNDGNYIYYGLNTPTVLATMFIGGAWWAYQEQHKKIVAYRKMIDMQKAFNEVNDIFSKGGYIEPKVWNYRGVVSKGEKLGEPKETIVFNIDENGNIDVVNDNGEQE